MNNPEAPAGLGRESDLLELAASPSSSASEKGRRRGGGGWIGGGKGNGPQITMRKDKKSPAPPREERIINL